MCVGMPSAESNGVELRSRHILDFAAFVIPPRQPILRLHDVNRWV